MYICTLLCVMTHHSSAEPISHIVPLSVLLNQLTSLMDVSNDFQDDSTTHHIDTGAFLHPDYFSFDVHNSSSAGDLDDDKSAASDNPSWIDPGSDENPTRYLHKDPGGFWSDSSSERSQDRKFPEPDIDFPDNSLKGDTENDEGLGKESSGSQTNSHVKPDNTANDAGNNKNRSIVWWKMPMEILRYCAFKMSPVWAVSVAAAVMGFVILGRSLYKMKKKKKTKRLEIKLSVDDKKLSQVISHANRLNDGFSILKRVPVIRSSLPAAIGSTSTWPVMSLR